MQYTLNEDSASVHGRAVHVILFMWLPHVPQGYHSRKYVSDITLEFEADPQCEAIPFLQQNMQRFYFASLSFKCLTDSNWPISGCLRRGDTFLLTTCTFSHLLLWSEQVIQPMWSLMKGQ